MNETIQAEDIDTGSVQSSEILNETIQAEDIDTGSVESSEILDETIKAKDIGTGAVESDEIANRTILNEDIANNTINLSTKVTDILSVENGGTGVNSLTDGGLLVGNGNNDIETLSQGDDGEIPVGVTNANPVMKLLAQGSGIKITQKSDSVIISSTISGGESADGTKNIDIGTIAPGDTYTSPSFTVPDSDANQGDIILASLDVNLQGCMMTPYFTTGNTAKIAIFNGTGGTVNLGNNVQVKLLIVQ